MLEISFIRENKERILEGLKVRNFPEKDWTIVDKVLDLDEKRKAVQTELDNILAERNALSKSIGDFFKQGKKEEADQLKLKVNALKEGVSQLEDDLKATKEALAETLVILPNIPHPSVPPGHSD